VEIASTTIQREHREDLSDPGITRLGILPGRRHSQKALDAEIWPVGDRRWMLKGPSAPLARRSRRLRFPSRSCCRCRAHALMALSAFDSHERQVLAPVRLESFSRGLLHPEHNFSMDGGVLSAFRSQGKARYGSSQSSRVFLM
jgi:hypothetical protein